ncbi:MAG: ABC transport system periplasmic substrate binding protein [uncultured bacterium]|nr:MAG: ABC transport system periplasmic substrate binding protein [uncultured bacterium]
MDTKVNYAMVGAFVIVLFSAIVLSVIWLSSGFSIDKYTTYEVFMQEAVTGLSVDATVEYNGVSVGTVKSISLNQSNPHLVDLLLNIKSDTPVTEGTFASLNTRGLTGITYIALKDKSTDLRPLKAKEGQPYPVIKTAPSFFLQLDTALSRLNDSVQKVSESLQALLDKDNLHSIKEILANLDKVTENIVRNNQKLSSILTNTERASRQLPYFVEASTSTMQILQAQTLPETNRIMVNLGVITENLAELSRELQQNPAILIRGREQIGHGPGER